MNPHAGGLVPSVACLKMAWPRDQASSASLAPRSTRVRRKIRGVIGATTLLLVNCAVVRFLYVHQALEHTVEGGADVLIEGGRVRADRLKRELITPPQLEAAAHRQGFASLDEVERAVLEPSGTISFSAKRPTPEAVRHGELLARLDGLTRELAALRAGLGPSRT